MTMIDIIRKKRDGKVLSREEISYFVSGVTAGAIPDYQASALLMAIYFQGLSPAETSDLTLAMAHSGAMLDLADVPGIKVDKHSTGGVADTTTLVLAPLVASLGVPVIKMSGRGLGFSGGTLDKLESIPGFHIGISLETAIYFARDTGIVLMGQTENLTPADQKLYALRDVTGTVENLSLIAASIMSKKIAAGADAIVLDVKCGSGAFMKDLASAKALANEMLAIGKSVGRQVSALISSMEQPLGNCIGNALEVIEAIELLKGNIPEGDLLAVSLTLGSMMLLQAGAAASLSEGRALLQKQIANGQGLEKFRQLLLQQGGDPHMIEDYSLLPRAQKKKMITSPQAGYVSHIQTDLIGRAALETGAGRMKKEDPIDYGAGIIMQVRLGDHVEQNAPLAEIYAATDAQCDTAAALLQEAIHLSEEKPAIPDLILCELQ